MSNRPRVLLADDHRIVAEGIKQLLEPEFDLVGIVEDGRSLVEQAEKLHPDVIVADITMPELNGIDALHEIRNKDSRVKVIFLTMHREVAFARRALEEGASGFVLKHSAAEELVMAIRAALRGQKFITPTLAGELVDSIRKDPQSKDPLNLLTARQREILQQFAEGKSAKEIAAALDISTRTVEFHKYEMIQAIGIKNSVELIHFAIKHGIVQI
jgi:DNA-binding NarL/FixJ family response regulator